MSAQQLLVHQEEMHASQTGRQTEMDVESIGKKRSMPLHMYVMEGGGRKGKEGEGRGKRRKEGEGGGSNKFGHARTTTAGTPRDAR
jgi:hypothetical protein